MQFHRSLISFHFSAHSNSLNQSVSLRHICYSYIYTKLTQYNLNILLQFTSKLMCCYPKQQPCCAVSTYYACCHQCQMQLSFTPFPPPPPPPPLVPLPCFPNSFGRPPSQARQASPAPSRPQLTCTHTPHTPHTHTLTPGEFVQITEFNKLNDF